MPGTPAERLEADIDDYLRYLAQVKRLSPNTVRSYASDLAAFAGWVGRSGANAYALTNRGMRGYLMELGRAGYAEKTINRKLSAARSFYAWLELEGRAEASSVAAMEGRKQSKRLPRVMSDEDVRLMLDAVSGTGDPLKERDRAAIELLYATGARIAELVGLELGDFDAGYTQVRLFGKGSKERIVPLYDAAARAVRGYIVESRPQLLAKARHATDALLLSKSGRPLSTDAMRKRFEAIAREAGVRGDVTPHVVRHTYATELLDGGADLRSVQELLGHASLSTTQIYTHLSVEGLKETVRLAHPRAESS